MKPILAIKVSKYDSAHGVVKAVCDALMQVSVRDVEFDNGERGALIFVIQALPWIVGSNGDPWSKSYPTRDQAIALCAAHAPVEIRVAS